MHVLACIHVSLPIIIIRQNYWRLGGGVIADFSKNGSHLIVIEHVCRINKWRPGFILPRIAKVNLVTLQSSYPSWVLDDT